MLVFSYIHTITNACLIFEQDSAGLLLLTTLWNEFLKREVINHNGKGLRAEIEMSRVNIITAPLLHCIAA